MATSAPALIEGIGLTVTVTVAAVLHPGDEVPVTVYIVVTDGEALTLAPVVAVSPVAGVHE
jgi:hypothetical protein